MRLVFSRTVWALALLAACGDPPLDTTRNVPERGTLGAEIFRLFHRDFEREDQRRADGFMLAREDFVGAVDHLFPPQELQYTQDFLVELLPLYDDETFPNTTRMLADVAERLAQDEQALRSLAAINRRTGYVDLKHEAALIRRIASYPKYRDLIKALLDLHLGHDGLNAAGELDASEPNEVTRLSRLLARRMQALELSEDAERTIVLVADLLLQEDERLSEPASPTAAAEPRIVARDVRGMAKVRSPSGRVQAPFSDSAPQDGLPDVDVLGRFVSTSGTPLDMSPFGEGSVPGATRDSTGQLVTDTGDPLFEYVDLEQTILAGLLRDGRTLIHEGVPLKAVRTIDALLGERLPDGTYGTANSAVLDLVHALSRTADMTELPDLLDLLRVLLEHHEATTMWVVLETETQLDIADRYNVSLKPANTFFNDLMSVLRKILREPGLAEALLDTIRDPAFANGFIQAETKTMRHKKAKITELDVANGTVFTELVDRTQPDRGANQSLHQRILHLLHDTKGAKYEPSFIGVPLGFIFEIEDLAEFYMKSIIGEARVPSLVSSLTGLSTQPTPQELAVFLNKDQTFGNPKGHEGIEVKDNDGDTLFAVTESGMADALRPLVRLFHDRGQLRLLFELFEVMHMHYASTESDYQNQDASQPRYSKLSGISKYEPLLIDTFENARVFDSVKRLLDETENVRTSRGRAAHDLLLLIARKVLEKNSGLETRDGKREVIVDAERITPLSPFDLIRDARSKLKRAVRRTNQSQADWDALVDSLHRTFLETERMGPEAGRIKNRRAVPILSALLSFFEERALKQQQARTLASWMHEDFPRAVEEMITAPELPAAIDMIYALEADERISTTLSELRDELLAEDQGFPDLLVVVGDLVQASKDASIGVPLARWLGHEIDPDKKLFFTLNSLAKRTLELDEDEHFLEVARRAIDDAPRGGFYGEGIVRAVRQAHRQNALDYGLSDANDLLRITSAIVRYMRDDQHGLEKFYDMVDRRTLEDRQ